MQYLLTKEEYDALKNSARDEWKKVLEDVLAAFAKELHAVVFHEEFGVGGSVVRLPDLKAAVEKTRNRFQ